MAPAKKPATDHGRRAIDPGLEGWLMIATWVQDTSVKDAALWHPVTLFSRFPALTLARIFPAPTWRTGATVYTVLTAGQARRHRKVWPGWFHDDEPAHRPLIEPEGGA